MSDDTLLPMSSSRPYFLRAMWQWLVDNDLTPHILVDAEYPETQIPQQFVQDGQIVLNISPSAAMGLSLENDWITFNARFSGTPMNVSIPTAAVMGIYARENGQGMFFEVDEDPEPTPTGPKPVKSSPTQKPAEKKPNKGKPSLQIVK